MVSVFLCLPALRNSSSESRDTRHVRYPSISIVISAEAVVAEVQACQCPDGRKYIRGRTEGYSCAYWHLGRKAVSMMAPETPKPLSLKSALVMEASMVTGLLLDVSPLMVSFFIALMVGTPSAER